MALSDAEKAALVSVLDEIKPKFQEIGAEAMESLFKDHPDTKSYFSHMDVTPGSQDLKTQGGKVMDAIYDALKNYGNLHENLAKLRELHTTKLKLNVDTIMLLCTSLVPVIVKHCSTADSSACEKFLHDVAKNLIEA
ncbi:hemoglobin heart muscle subunit alpha-type-like isoform X3 [Hyla sarda]|uniref:hemoglobin heart muscle subunit alpha-type-like isoform X2 n=1 Tax=Hyla sarda TaxID=327740 RepID=UPI0024C383D9|nr:hemoglobin heart muscle subunit alpha-type-like isoform X2 [Hyla sarda]XP_056424527.1 hemoglobin heart muscle subunit alpha-type-like isoform X3 [Hyla sarda]